MYNFLSAAPIPDLSPRTKIRFPEKNEGILTMARPRKIPFEEALAKLDKSKRVSPEVKGGKMEIEWLSQVGFPKRHAVPKGEGISLCGRGGDRSWQKEPSDLPKCKKCLYLIKYKGIEENKAVLENSE